MKSNNPLYFKINSPIPVVIFVRFHLFFLFFPSFPNIISNRQILYNDDYLSFKNRTLFAKATSVYIEQAACPTLIDEPKHFSNALNSEITFFENDFRYNKVVLSPLDRKVYAEYRMGHDLTLGLPSDLQTYKLNFQNLVEVTVADLDYIVTWTKAKSLTIDDRCDAALGLLRRIDAMSAMTDLSFLRLNIRPNILERMRLRPFLRNLPSLRSIQLEFDHTISESDIRAFIERQDIPKEFGLEMYTNHEARYTKNPVGVDGGIW